MSQPYLYSPKLFRMGTTMLSLVNRSQCAIVIDIVIHDPKTKRISATKKSTRPIQANRMDLFHFVQRFTAIRSFRSFFRIICWHNRFISLAQFELCKGMQTHIIFKPHKKTTTTNITMLLYRCNKVSLFCYILPVPLLCSPGKK